MYYSAIGLLGIFLLLIQNYDILFRRGVSLQTPVWKTYRRFLIAVLLYYVTDILWGYLESRHLRVLLFADTSLYFVAMAAGVLLWTQYGVAYLEENTRFGRFLITAGRVLAAAVTLLSAVNLFVPVLFTVDGDCVYHAYPVRYAILGAQVLLLLLVSIYTTSSILREKDLDGKQKRYRTMGLFGLIMAVFLTTQLYFPYLPLYAIAFMLGTCLLHTFVITDEKEEYRNGLQEAARIAEMMKSMAILLDNIPGLSFSKDAETGVFLACNRAFAEYARKDSPEDVVGLTDADLFDPVTAEHCMEDDRMALSMDEPYIFFEEVTDASGNRKQLQTTKLKFVDPAGRLCLLGICSDVTDMVRIQRENATTREAYERARSTGIIYNHLAQALARGYTDLYYVNMDTGEFIEYQTDDDLGVLTEARRGSDFFEGCERDAKLFVHPEDQDAFVRAMDRDFLTQALARNKVFVMTYRRIKGGRSFYVMMKVSRMEDDERFLVLGVTDIDEQIKQRRLEERLQEERIIYARLHALTGSFLCIYVVDLETNRYREFAATDDYVESFSQAKEGTDFFAAVRDASRDFNHPDDLERFLSVFTKENIMAEIERSGIFTLGYRLYMEGKPRHVQLKAAMVEEKEGPRLVVGINDIDVQVRQEEEYGRRLAQAQTRASIDALTGVKNKRAYLDAEARLDSQIKEERLPEFAVVILDVNDLKIINDTAGHQAGDQCIRDACKTICDIFKHSPVFRVGGDEFAVITQGNDYARIDELLEQVDAHNAEAARTGGVVVACGMSRYDNDGSVAPVFERADQNMYENKNLLKHRAE